MAVLAIRWPSSIDDIDSGERYGASDDYNSSGHRVAVGVYTKDTASTFDLSSHSASDLWFFTSVNGSLDQDANAVIFKMSGATEDLFRIICVDTVTSGGQQKAQYYNGSTWLDIATFTTNLSGLATLRLDVHLKIADSGGEFTVYVDGASEASFTGDTLLTADTEIDSITLSGCDASTTNPFVWRPIVVADADTRGMEFWSSIPASNGNHTETTGSESSVDNYLYSSGYSSEYAVGDADGERLTLNFYSIASEFSGYSVAAVAVGLNAKAQSEPGLYIKPLARDASAATDYNPGSSFQPRSTGIGSFFWTMLTDPATASAWASQADVEDYEFGFELSSTA